MFRPGDTVIHTSTGIEMQVNRILPGPVYRCAWTTQDGNVWYEHQGEYEKAALILSEARNDNDNRYWRQRDAG